MKRFIYLILILLLVGCSQSKKDFVVKLNLQEGYGVFVPGEAIVWPSIDSLVYRNVPENIDEYVVRSLAIQPSQFYWNKYLDKSITKEQFKEVVKYYKIDTTKLTNKKVDSEVLFLIGTKAGKRIIIVDSDNDEDFGDEKILEYEYPLTIEEQKAIKNTLPIVSTQYEYFENDKIVSKEVNIKPSPYKGSVIVNFYTDDVTEKKYFLSASFPQYKKGYIDFNGLAYDVFVSNRFTGIDYSPDKISIFITSQSDSLPAELNGDIPYEIGDVFNVKGHDYLIDSITNWGEELFIKYIGKNTMPRDFKEEYYMPKFKAKRLDNSVFELKQYPGKYILFDFWGTWCQPCIKLIPELKKLNSEFPKDKFVLVSVAYDSDSKKVLDFTLKKNMDWEHLFVNDNKKDENSLIEKLKIHKFPTIILIDPTGKIVARDKTMDEVKEILRKALK